MPWAGSDEKRHERQSPPTADLDLRTPGIRPPAGRISPPTAVTTATSLDSQPLKASALFHIDYGFHWKDSKPGLSDLQNFAEVNAVFNSWPYWRQLVQSMLPSMGVHKLVIPVFRFPFPSRS